MVDNKAKALFPFGHGSISATTKSGTAVSIRNIVASDDQLLFDLYKQLSPETRRLRFLSARPNLPDEEIWKLVTRLSHIDAWTEAALVATMQDEDRERAVGVARLARDQSAEHAAEFAIVIRDDYQQEGLGTLLFDLLLQVAMVRGLTSLRGYSLAENQGLLRLVQKVGLPFTRHTSYGETMFAISLLDQG
jgi:RimJ/RimL family protein N-acetyltransferase